MKKKGIMRLLTILFAALPVISACTQEEHVEGSYPPFLMYQNKLYITAPDHPDTYVVDENNLIQVGMIETTTTNNLREMPTENLQSNFGMVGQKIYISSDHSDVVFVPDDGQYYAYTLHLEE